MKTVLYYLSFSTLRIEKEKAIRKLKQVLWTFEQNRERVGMLWYQDPLMESRALLLPEAVLRAYETLVSGFAAGQGRLLWPGEESSTRSGTHKAPALMPCEEEALRICDAYYGDPGYLCLVFRNAGKPVMLQNLEIGVFPSEGAI